MRVRPLYQEVTMKLPELLSPAGSPEALAAAIDGGADAVYFGGSAFNARIFADNFGPAAMREAVALCHTYGARAYLTLNTLPLDREMGDFLDAAYEAALAGVDALIVADLGGAAAIRRTIPGLELHASTQASGHNAAAGQMLHELGFSRMVCARELSLTDIKAFVAASPIEAEVFVHGALCVCHSGQCLFSSLIGGRSGNRGACAQPCRLPYAVGKGTGYPLSLKDLCLAEHVPALIEAGVASLKIEGRMKAPEYVNAVTRVWRKLLDERRAATPEEMAYLAEIFSRDGFTDRYFTHTDRRLPDWPGREMLGVRTEGDKQKTRTLPKWTSGTAVSRKLPVELAAILKQGEPARLTMSEPDGNCVSVAGEVPQIARNPAAAMTRESAGASLSKLGNTPFEAMSVTVEVDPGLILPASSLNALRRSAAEALWAQKESKASKDTPAAERRSHRPKKPLGGAGQCEMRTARFSHPSAVTQSAKEYFDLIYLPLAVYDGSVVGVALPPVIFDSERAEVERQLRRAVELGATDLLVSNLGHLSLARETGLRLHGDLRLNVTNAETAALLQELGFVDILLSPELTLPQVRDISGGNAFAGVITYGRVPLMFLEKCVIREVASCRECRQGKAALTDRKGISFPVMREGDHRNVVYNSVPIYMADRETELRANRVVHRHFLFSIESPQEVDRILRAHREGWSPNEDVRRIK